MPVPHDTAIEAEKELSALVEAGDERAVIDWLEGPGAALVEFTGRCFGAAVSSGMADASLLMGRLGFHLAVTDDKAAKRAIDQAKSMRGLLGFLEDYRYCKAQRSYYLPVVESDASLGPIEQLLAHGLLSANDKAELLSLALRSDKPKLARALAAGGARLSDGMRDDVPKDLRKSRSDLAANEKDLWARLATPQRTLETLSLIFERTEGHPCSIHRSWWGSYGRQPEFARKLSEIACRSCTEACDCTASLLATLAAAGTSALPGLSTVLTWENLEQPWLDDALAAAQEANNAQGAALIMRAAQNVSSAADELDLLEF